MNRILVALAAAAALAGCAAQSATSYSVTPTVRVVERAQRRAPIAAIAPVNGSGDSVR
jgi:uncharacterized lipoprotein YajG